MSYDFIGEVPCAYSNTGRGPVHTGSVPDGLGSAAAVVAGAVASGGASAGPRCPGCFRMRLGAMFDGGGWSLLYNSVGDADGQTTAFWQFPYVERFDTKGTPDLDANF